MVIAELEGIKLSNNVCNAQMWRQMIEWNKWIISTNVVYYFLMNAEKKMSGDFELMPLS